MRNCAFGALSSIVRLTHALLPDPQVNLKAIGKHSQHFPSCTFSQIFLHLAVCLVVPVCAADEGSHCSMSYLHPRRHSRWAPWVDAWLNNADGHMNACDGGRGFLLTGNCQYR